MEKVLLRTGLPHRIRELTWYTPEQLISMGIWKPHSMKGLERVTEQRRKERERVLREKLANAEAAEVDEPRGIGLVELDAARHPMLRHGRERGRHV